MVAKEELSGATGVDARDGELGVRGFDKLLHEREVAGAGGSVAVEGDAVAAALDGGLAVDGDKRHLAAVVPEEHVPGA